MKCLKKTTGIFLTVCLIAALFICLSAVNSGAASGSNMFALNCDANNVKIEYLSGESNQLVPGEAYMLKAGYVSDYGYDESKLYNMFALWSCESDGGNTSFFRRMENFTERYDIETSTYIAEFNATAGGSDPEIVEGKNTYFQMRFVDRNGDGTVKNCKVYLADISLIRVSTGEDLLADVPIDEKHVTTAQITSHHGLWRIYPEAKISLKNKTSVFGTEYTAGDVNDDGATDNKDLTRFFQYLSGWEVLVSPGALDVNGDKSVDNKDLTRLFQYLSGWDVEVYFDESKGSLMDRYSNSSGYFAAKTFTGGASEEAQALKNQILSTGNTEDIYNITGKKYYISKTMSLSSIPKTLNSGDAVLFERGGVWRVNPTELAVPNGVIFGAYGEGDKPMLLGSAKNYAGEGIWTSAGDNLWKTSLKGGNAGIIVFDNAYALGVLKWNKDEIESNYDFYTDEDTETLYMYYSGDIADDFDSIEIGQRNYVMRVRSNAIVDNICVKYTGGHGIVMPTGTENSKVTNCEVGFIGGSKHTSSSRFGNGVELQLGVKHIELSNNYVYQCYDAGLTFQSWDSANQATYYDDLDISNNLVEFCYYGLEFFTTVPELGGSYSELHNISVKDNIFRFSGYAWSYKQRPDHWMTGHIRSSQRGWYEETENFVIEDNIFDCSRTSMIFWWWHDTKGNFVHPEPHPGVTVRGNSFYQTFTTDNRCMNYRYETPRYATDLKGLKDAVAVFDSTPQKVVWLDEI